MVGYRGGQEGGGSERAAGQPDAGETPAVPGGKAQTSNVTTTGA